MFEQEICTCDATLYFILFISFIVKKWIDFVSKVPIVSMAQWSVQEL